MDIIADFLLSNKKPMEQMEPLNALV